MKRFIAVGALLLPSLSWAGATAWLGPEPPGKAYPAGEADRQYAMLRDVLADSAVGRGRLKGQMLTSGPRRN
jgi:hypothetical protein